MKRKGFTLIEMLIAMIFMSLILLGYLSVTTSSSQASMDAYFEFMAFQAAQETIEVFRAFGFHWLIEYADNRNVTPLSRYPIDTPHVLDSLDYPGEMSSFERTINLKKISDHGTTGVLISVTISPIGQSRAWNWLTQKNILLQSLVVECPK